MNKVRSNRYWFRRSPRQSHRQSRTGWHVATFQATIVLAIGIWAYQFPFAGSLALFYFTTVIYGLSLVDRSVDFITLLDTTPALFGVFVFMMPAILLSGYVSPVENMQVRLQNLRRLTLFGLYGHYQQIY
ncbi:hypothetical protein ACNKHU_04525 [Shigella flexneri]